MSTPKLSREEMLRLAKTTADHGLAPQAPLIDGPTPEPTTARRIFDRRKLRQAEPGRCEWYTMPDGSEVCIHGVSPEEAAYFNRQALKEITALGLMPQPGEPPAAAELKQREAVIESQFRGQVWQVISVCRQGEAPNSPAVFDSGDAESLRRSRYYLESIQDICRISDACSKGRSEADLLREQYAGFFGDMGSWLRTWCSQLTTESLESSRELLLAFANSVSGTKLPEKFSAPE